MQTTIGPVPHSLSGVYFAFWKLQASCYFICEISMGELSHYNHSDFSTFGKRATFHSLSGISIKGNMFVVFKVSEAHCKHLVPTDLLAGEEVHWPCFKWGLCQKKVRVAFHCKLPLGLVFFHEVENNLQGRKLHASFFVSFVRLLCGAYHLNIAMYC